jgi:predicted acylesterase/phospholipase RssA
MDVETPLPTRFCDVVMKGGITSGVVYPLAVYELSKGFRFKNIGGTSAGAIAAAAAAAAELGRYRNAGGGFEDLAQLPQFLSSRPAGESRTHLFAFFQPQHRTMRVFNTCVAGLGGGATAPARITIAACRNFWLPCVAGALPGLLFAWLAWRQAGGALSPAIAVAVLGIVTAIVGALLATAAAFAIVSVRQIPRNFFGLTSGMGGAGKTRAQPLTPWLTAYLNELAGLDPDGDPLTFGQLWHANPSSSEATINLEMVTTSVTHGRPYRLPFRDDEHTRDNRQFFFKRADFERLFPERVVAWLEARPRVARADSADAEAGYLRDGYIPLPEPADLPVVVAVRMSVSFPLLLSAVPLYAIDRSRKHVSDQQPERCWFSDGGISSNFPVHFFDAPLPRWPTFGIDLTEKHPDYDTGFYMPRTNRAGTLVKWRRFDTGSPFHRLLGFVAGIVMTAKDWADNAQIRLPGFRDRIAQVSLSAADGGLNLDMTPERIARLCAYGQEAGREFVKRFASSDPGCVLDWSNHRRVRLRSALAAIEEWLLKLERGCAEPQPGDPPYAALIKDSAPPSYPWKNSEQQALAEEVLAQLETAALSLPPLSSSAALKTGSPRPRPELRTRARI